MNNAITSKGWDTVAQTPLGREFAAKLAARSTGARLDRDPLVSTYRDNVQVKVDRDKVVVEVNVDDFGAASRNAVAARTIIGDVTRALRTGHHFEVLIRNSVSNVGIYAALGAYLKEYDAYTKPDVLGGEEATRFVATRPA